MSVSLWAYIPQKCDGNPCRGDCDLCSKANDDLEILPESVLYSPRGDHMPQPKTSQRKQAYDKEYYKNFIQRKVLNFNRTIPEDAELLEWLETRGAGEMSQYIKSLIRADMEKAQHD